MFRQLSLVKYCPKEGLSFGEFFPLFCIRTRLDLAWENQYKINYEIRLRRTLWLTGGEVTETARQGWLKPRVNPRFWAFIIKWKNGNGIHVHKLEEKV